MVKIALIGLLAGLASFSTVRADLVSNTDLASESKRGDLRILKGTYAYAGHERPYFEIVDEKNDVRFAVTVTKAKRGVECEFEKINLETKEIEDSYSMSNEFCAATPDDEQYRYVLKKRGEGGLDVDYQSELSDKQFECLQKQIIQFRGIRAKDDFQRISKNVTVIDVLLVDNSDGQVENDEINPPSFEKVEDGIFSPFEMRIGIEAAPKSESDEKEKAACLLISQDDLVSKLSELQSLGAEDESNGDSDDSFDELSSKVPSIRLERGKGI